MSALKIGVQLASLGLPFRKALQAASRLGADAVEIDVRRELKPDELSQTGIRSLRKTLDDLGLQVCALSFRTRRGYHSSDDLDRRIAASKRAMDLAYRLGATIVINQVGQIPAESDDPQWQLLTAVLADLGRHGQRVGALLAAETGTESGADMARLIDALPAGSLSVNLDPGNLIINGFSPREAVESIGQHVVHVHAKDGVRDLAQGRGIEVQLGRGSADFPALIGSLEDHQYRGYFTVERERSDDPTTEIGQAIAFLRNM